MAFPFLLKEIPKLIITITMNCRKDSNCGTHATIALQTVKEQYA